jgi:hypothetical protein
MVMMTVVFVGFNNSYQPTAYKGHDVNWKNLDETLAY